MELATIIYIIDFNNEIDQFHLNNNILLGYTVSNLTFCLDKTEFDICAHPHQRNDHICTVRGELPCYRLKTRHNCILITQIMKLLLRTIRLPFLRDSPEKSAEHNGSDVSKVHTMTVPVKVSKVHTMAVPVPFWASWQCRQAPSA